MRKQLAILCLLLTLQTYVFAAFGTKSAWDVQTTGADTNGGAFDPGVASPGTDESQGSGTAITVTLTGATTGTCSPSCTSTTHGPGNFIHIASGSGCSTGWFEILSQSAGTITVDHSMGSSTDACVGVIGGSLLTITQANTNVVGGNTIYIKNGTYTDTSLFTTAAVTNLTFSGYGSTHNDLGTPPLWTTATNSTNLIATGTSGKLVFQNIKFTNTAGTRGIGIYCSTSDNLIVDHSYLSGFTFSVDGDNGVSSPCTSMTVSNSEITAFTEYGITNDGPLYVYYNYVHDGAMNSAHGFAAVTNNGAAQPTTAVGNVIVNNTCSGCSSYNGGLSLSTGPNLVANNTIADNSYANIVFTVGAWTATFDNNIIYGSVHNYGISTQLGTYLPLFYYSNGNAYGGNSSGDADTGVTTGLNPTTGISSPFVSSSNWALSAGGITAIGTKGFPGTFAGVVNSAGTGYATPGALPPQNAGGGGSGASGSMCTQ